MGGTPWQSTGCLACRKRKVKCDKQEPECERCTKRGLQCPGYDKLRIFFHQEFPSTRKEKPENSKRSSAARLQNHDLANPSETSDTDSATKTIYRNRARPLVLHRTAFDSGPTNRDQLFSLYLDAYFPIDIVGTTDIDPWYGLVSGLAALPNKSPMLERAIAAQSCIILGRRYDKGMFYHGLQLYNSAIQHMSHVIKRNVYTDDLVYTAAIFHALTFIQSIFCPSGLDVWFNQMTVTSGILKQCYPKASGSPLVRSIYQGFYRMRLLQALSPLQSKQEINPAEDQVPSAWESIEQRGQPIDELLHLMAEIAPLSATMNANYDPGHGASQAKEPLLNCVAHRSKLLSWYDRRKEDIGGGPFVRAYSEPVTRLPRADHLFGTPYSFSSLDNARIHVLFWAALSILESLIAQDRFLSAEAEYSLSELYADKISRALPFCLQDSMKAWGGHVTVFGVGQISKVYIDSQRRDKFIWSQQAFRVMADMGSDFSTHVGKMLSYSWSLVENEDSCQSLRPVVENANTLFA